MRERNPLALARFTRGLTQQELATRAEVAKNTVQRIEGGDLPTLRTALKIPHALKADVWKLFPADCDDERIAA